jgi:hypothetical protein
MSIRNGTGRGSWGVGENDASFVKALWISDADFKARCAQYLGQANVKSVLLTYIQNQKVPGTRLNAFVHTKSSCLADEGSLSPISATVDISGHSIRANGAAKQSCRAKQAYRLVQQGCYGCPELGVHGKCVTSRNSTCNTDTT